MCDGTQNLNNTDTFFRYKIFSIPVLFLVSICEIPKSVSVPVLRLFPVPIFLISVPIPPKNDKFPVVGIPGTGTSHSDVDMSLLQVSNQPAFVHYVTSRKIQLGVV